MHNIKLTRRTFAKLSVAAGALAAGWPSVLRATAGRGAPPLTEVAYGDVSIDSAAHRAQLTNTQDVLMNLSEDSLLKPFRQMAGQPAPGEDLGGWYNYDPNFDWHKDDAGFAPGATFGQWVSALARFYAMSGSQAVREKVLRLNRLYARTISESFYDKNRFPAYCYDKLLLGLIDSHQFAHDSDAFAVLERTTRAALPHLPRAAVDRELEWRAGKDQSYRLGRVLYQPREPVSRLPARRGGALPGTRGAVISTTAPGSTRSRGTRTYSRGSMRTATSIH